MNRRSVTRLDETTIAHIWSTKSALLLQIIGFAWRWVLSSNRNNRWSSFPRLISLNYLLYTYWDTTVIWHEKPVYSSIYQKMKEPIVVISKYDDEESVRNFDWCPIRGSQSSHALVDHESYNHRKATSTQIVHTFFHRSCFVNWGLSSTEWLPGSVLGHTESRGMRVPKAVGGLLPLNSVHPSTERRILFFRHIVMVQTFEIIS